MHLYAHYSYRPLRPGEGAMDEAQLERNLDTFFHEPIDDVKVGVSATATVAPLRALNGQTCV